MPIKYPRHQRKKKSAANRAPASGTTKSGSLKTQPSDASYGTVITTVPFHLREDGTIAADKKIEASLPQLIFHNEASGVRLYQGNSMEIMDAIAAKHPEGYFDMIFADPPYFLSNGGISCHAGKMVKVDKGDWDKSRGPELNHEFNRAWLERCQRVLKPNGTIWVSGTHHVIFSVGFALQQLGFRILNDIAWEKPNPPPNLGCRCFTHSTETILWAAKTEESEYTFNYAAMKAVKGKQMKTVWRQKDFFDSSSGDQNSATKASQSEPESIWTLTAPGRDEKNHGKHPTQKPIALLERCLLASTNEGDARGDRDYLYASILNPSSSSHFPCKRIFGNVFR